MSELNNNSTEVNKKNDELINRQAVINTAVQSIEDWDGMFKQDANCRIRNAINKLPSAQPEIIRCGECKYRRNQSETTAWLPCRALIVPDDFSCIRADRREDG